MIIDASKERAELASQEGGGIISENTADPMDGNKKETKKKNIKEVHKMNNMMPNQKDFYGLKHFSQKNQDDIFDGEDDQIRDTETDVITPSLNDSNVAFGGGAKSEKAKAANTKTPAPKTSTPDPAGHSNSIEIIKKAVENLKDRIEEIETKVNEVDEALDGQETLIRQEVMNVKNKWILLNSEIVEEKMKRK